MPEGELISAILLRFGSHPQIRLWRINTLGAKAHGGRVIRSAPKGHPDLAGVMAPGVPIYLECKSETGRLSKEQVAWGEMLTKYGARYAVVRSLEDVARALPELGL